MSGQAIPRDRQSGRVPEPLRLPSGLGAHLRSQAQCALARERVCRSAGTLPLASVRPSMGRVLRPTRSLRSLRPRDASSQGWDGRRARVGRVRPCGGADGQGSRRPVHRGLHSARFRRFAVRAIARRVEADAAAGAGPGGGPDPRAREGRWALAQILRATLVGRMAGCRSLGSRTRGGSVPPVGLRLDRGRVDARLGPARTRARRSSCGRARTAGRPPGAGAARTAGSASAPPSPCRRARPLEWAEIAESEPETSAAMLPELRGAALPGARRAALGRAHPARSCPRAAAASPGTAARRAGATRSASPSPTDWFATGPTPPGVGPACHARARGGGDGWSGP